MLENCLADIKNEEEAYQRAQVQQQPSGDKAKEQPDVTPVKVIHDRIKRMRQSQLDKLTADFEQQKKKIDETIHSVDIYTNLQVKGILHVEG